jgi:GTP-binding protein
VGRESSRRLDEKLPTGAVNRLLEKLLQEREPSMREGQALKAYYAVQTSTRPFVSRIFCNRVDKLEEGYSKFLEARLHRPCSTFRAAPSSSPSSGKPKREKRSRTAERG